VLGSETDPKLPPGQIDLIIWWPCTHEFYGPKTMRTRIAGHETRRALVQARIPQGRYHRPIKPGPIK